MTEREICERINLLHMKASFLWHHPMPDNYYRLSCIWKAIAELQHKLDNMGLDWRVYGF
jgi:hypothetical protein